MTVGRSWRTPAKHDVMASFVGQEVGVINRSPYHRDITRLVWIDLTAGDAAEVDGLEWHSACSPGILARHASASGKTVAIALHEIQPATYDRLLANLDVHLPTLGYKKVGENRWRTEKVTLQAINKSGADADVSFVGQSDAVLAFNDPNAITEWAMRPTFAQEIKARRVWCYRALSTLGCNVAGIKRLDSDVRRGWFDLIGSEQGALPDYRDLLLAGIARDESQWAYLLNTPTKWRGTTEGFVRSAFGRVGREVISNWYRGDGVGFESAKRSLFLTKKELGAEVA